MVRIIPFTLPPLVHAHIAPKFRGALVYLNTIFTFETPEMFQELRDISPQNEIS